MLTRNDVEYMLRMLTKNVGEKDENGNVVPGQNTVLTPSQYWSKFYELIVHNDIVGVTYFLSRQRDTLEALDDDLQWATEKVFALYQKLFDSETTIEPPIHADLHVREYMGRALRFAKRIMSEGWHDPHVWSYMDALRSKVLAGNLEGVNKLQFHLVHEIEHIPDHNFRLKLLRYAHEIDPLTIPQSLRE